MTAFHLLVLAAALGGCGVPGVPGVSGGALRPEARDAAAGGAAATDEAAVGALTAAGDRLVDLTHAFDAQTIYWPTATPFRLTTVARGRTAAGYWYAANDYCAAEHGGTHLDAPIHFAEGRWAADDVPLARLIGPAVVIDVRPQASADPDYRLAVEDLRAWERTHGRIPPGAIVVLHSGWGARWPDRARSLGTAVPGDTANLHFPGFSRAAAEFLVRERTIDAVGTDTASIDHGPSTDFIAHRVLNGANVPALENLANLDRLPPAGATIVALPMKIRGGSGGPARVIAVLPPP
jgi:kynurenine formamidase